MAGCCPSRDYRRFFNRRFARRLANRYRKRGLDKTVEHWSKGGTGNGGVADAHNDDFYFIRAPGRVRFLP
jgi:predicted phosphoadenosine phosphosulfate sulfurtransferase